MTKDAKPEADGHADVDRELQSLGECVRALVNVDDETRARIMAYLCQRFGGCSS